MAKAPEAKKEPIKTYRVVKTGVIIKKGGKAEEVGSNIELTETKAGHLVNKVRLLEDYEAENKTQKVLKLDLDKAGKTNDKLADENAALKKQVADLMASIAKK